MQNSVNHQYLNLLKQCLSASLTDEKVFLPMSLDRIKPTIKRSFFKRLIRYLKKRGYQIVKPCTVEQFNKKDGSGWPPSEQAFSMLGDLRLSNVQQCVETILADNIPGDVIETGVWKGGSCILMKATLDVFGDNTRKVFVADSFRGLPPPDVDKYPEDEGDTFYTQAELAISVDQVRDNFSIFGHLDDRVVFLEGWFEDTLPIAPIEQLAILRLDGDMYGSTITALESLYHKLSPGGFCIIDDYALEACKKAVDDFRAANGITETIEKVDWTGHYWRKR